MRSFEILTPSFFFFCTFFFSFHFHGDRRVHSSRCKAVYTTRRDDSGRSIRIGLRTLVSKSKMLFIITHTTSAHTSSLRIFRRLFAAISAAYVPDTCNLHIIISRVYASIITRVLCTASAAAGRVAPRRSCPPNSPRRGESRQAHEK